MDLFKTLGLFVVTALAEIVGCYLPYLWLKQGKSVWLLVPGAISLMLFSWLLSCIRQLLDVSMPPTAVCTSESP